MQQERAILITFEDAQQRADFQERAEQTGMLVQSRDNGFQCWGFEIAVRIAGLLTELFFGVWEERLLAQLSARRYDCFDERDRRDLLQRTSSMAAEDDFCWGLFAGQGKEARLSSAIEEHLRQHDLLHWEGFTRFRLEGYREYLHTLLSIAADEVLSAQEERDYLGLLTGFLQEQKPGGEIHVFLFRQGMYDICTAGKDGLVFLEGGRLVGCEDLLVFSLLHLAPQKLHFHIEKPLPRVLHELLHEVFGAALQIEMLKAGPILGDQGQYH